MMCHVAWGYKLVVSTAPPGSPGVLRDVDRVRPSGSRADELVCDPDGF
jgi:hypothetical protein